MNIRNIHILRTLATLLLCVVAGSCSQDELGIEHGKTLSLGKYPLMFTATVDRMMSRAAENEPWVKGDEIAVQIDDYPAVGRYMLNEDGSVKESDAPLSWPYMEGYVKAWYPFVERGNTLEREIIDQSTGFHDIDFLYAATGKENYKNTIHLSFKHHMAKVCCKLFKGDGVTDEDIATAKVSFAGYPKASFKEGALSGSYIDGKEVNEWITPTSDFTALLVPQDMSGKSFIKVDLTVTMNDVRIPKVLIYKLETGKGELKAGTSYTFNITVNKDRLDIQSVSGQWQDDIGSKDADEVVRRVNLPEGHGQNLTFSSNVTPVYSDTRAGVEVAYLLVQGTKFTLSFKTTAENCTKGFVLPKDDKVNKMTCTTDKNICTFTFTLASPLSEEVNLSYEDHFQVGDVYYSDGTWGKCGVEGKTPIGIIFRCGAGGSASDGTLDDPENYDWRDRSIRGYAVALNDASEVPGIWAESLDNSHALTPVTNDSTSTKLIYSGYWNVKKILESQKYQDLFDQASATDAKKGLWAIKMAAIYRPAGILPGDAPAPEKSSGWYLPSIKQLQDIYNIPRHHLLFENVGGKNFFYLTLQTQDIGLPQKVTTVR